MPGIVNNAIPQQPAQPAAQAAPAAKAAPKALPPQAQRIVIAAKKVLGQAAIAQQIVAMIKAESDPATGIAKATLFLLRQVMAKVSGTMPPPPIILAAAAQVLVDVARLGAAAKLYKLTPELVKQAAQIGATLFKQQATKQPAAPVQAPVQPAAPTPGAAPVQQPVQAGV